MKEASRPKLLEVGTQITGYQIIKHIGHGGYGEIYKIAPLEGDDTPYAMKVESKNAKKHGINEEIYFMKALQVEETQLFPKLYSFGETSEYRFIVMELLGPSLTSVRKIVKDARFTQYTVTSVAIGMLRCIEEFHKRGFVHRDIKPSNFLFRSMTGGELSISLIDFGLARRFIDKETETPIIPRTYTGFTGTNSFASVHAHEGMELSRSDDIISWIYSVVDMADGKLPWTGSRDRDQIYRFKKSFQPDQLCKSLPHQFAQIYKIALSMTYYDIPNYSMYFNLLNDAMIKIGKEGHYDWEYADLSQLDDISAPNTDAVRLSTPKSTPDTIVNSSFNNLELTPIQIDVNGDGRIKSDGSNSNSEIKKKDSTSSCSQQEQKPNLHVNYVSNIEKIVQSRPEQISVNCCNIY